MPFKGISKTCCKQVQVLDCSFDIQWVSDKELQGQMVIKIIRTTIDIHKKQAKLSQKVNLLKLTSKEADWHNMPTPPSKETSMPTRNVVLTDHQALMIEELVNSGRYQNASEVLREGLRMVEQREKEDANHLQALREAMELGMADFEAGRYKQFDTKESLRAHLKSIVAKAAAAA